MISLISKLVAFRKFCYALHRRINDHITLQETERKSAEKKTNENGDLICNHNRLCNVP